MKPGSMILPTAAAAFALAAQARAAEAPATTVSGNVAVVSDYVFRGLSQTWGRPAVQAGADLALSDGLAAGVWASTVSGNSYPGGSLELDLYASFGAAITDGASWRAGLYGYVYPGADLRHAGLAPRSLDTCEANFALAWRWLTLKYSYALTDYFGADVEQGYRGSSRGTRYLQLDATLPLGDAWSLALHAGRTDYPTTLAMPNAEGARHPDYVDLGATLKYRLAARWSASLGFTHAGNPRFYRHTAAFANADDVRDVGGSRAFVMLQGTF